MTSNDVNNRASSKDHCRTRNISRVVGPFIAPDSLGVNPTRLGMMIPYASGNTLVNMNTNAVGVAIGYAFIGFGSAFDVAGPLFNPIDVATIRDEAFAVSRAGSIASIAASYTEPSTFNLGNRIFIVNARIYQAAPGSTRFFATNATVDLEPLTGNIVAGTTVHGESANFAPVPINVGDRLLLVFSLTEVGATGVGNLQGRVSASITIE